MSVDSNTELSDIVDAAGKIFLTVPAIKRFYALAPDVAPSSSGDLPCVITVVDTVNAKAQAFGYLRLDFSLKFLLLVRPHNSKLAELEKVARPFMIPVCRAFFGRVRLADRAHIDHIGNEEKTISMDYRSIPYAGVDYIGYEIYLPITAKLVVDQQS